MDNIFWCVNTQKDFFKKGKYNIPSSENILNNLNDLTQLIKLKNSARNTVEEHYDLPIMVEKTVNIYKSVMK